MAKVREVGILTLQEAKDNLATIVGINLDTPPRLGILGRNRFVTDEETFGAGQVLWLSGEGPEAILQILDATFNVLFHHLIALYENPEMDWESEQNRKGLQAMMALAGEAAAKMNAYLEYRLGKPLGKKVEARPSFLELQYFYQHRIEKKFQGGGESWAEDFQESDEAPLLEFSKTGLQDFEAVRRDQEYDLFSIRNEEGHFYFNADLLRNIKLACDFTAAKDVSFEEDPLLRVRSMEDRDLEASAQQILRDCHRIIDEYFRMSKALAENSLALHIGPALMALFLSANPRNLIQNTNGKSSLQYFVDFHEFLREAMNSSEYQKHIAYPPELKDKTAHLLMNLVHRLCYSFFFRLGGVKLEAIALLHRCMRKGEQKAKLPKGETIWNQFLIEDEKLRTFLAQFPNGPLFKILDLVREEDLEKIAFDPMSQGNLPQKVYEMSLSGEPIDVIRMPCPVKQAFINKVAIAEEFRGLLRAYALEKPAHKHLMIHLQDRTSWKEYARANAMEMLQKNAEFNGKLIVVTLAKSTDFYHQNNEYIDVNNAHDFIAMFHEQLKDPETCGFFFPTPFGKGQLQSFANAALPFIHETFFRGQSQLTRQQREDFIELFYQFLVLKIIETVKPNALSFTCKDAIDTGPAAHGLFFGFLQIIRGGEDVETDFLRWLFYIPALFIRERAVDAERLSRAISALERLDTEMTENRSEILKKMAELYQPDTLESLSVKHT